MDCWPLKCPEIGSVINATEFLHEFKPCCEFEHCSFEGGIKFDGENWTNEENCSNCHCKVWFLLANILYTKYYCM